MNAINASHCHAHHLFFVEGQRKSYRTKNVSSFESTSYRLSSSSLFDPTDIVILSRKASLQGSSVHCKGRCSFFQTCVIVTQTRLDDIRFTLPFTNILLKRHIRKEIARFRLYQLMCSVVVYVGFFISRITPHRLF